jgi:hypothetical protein
MAADQSGKEIRFLFQYYKQRPESNVSLDLGYPICLSTIAVVTDAMGATETHCTKL